MVMFGITLGGLWQQFKGFWVQFRVHVEVFLHIFLQMLQNQQIESLQAKSLVCDIVTNCFCITSGNFLSIWFMLLSRRHFCSICSYFAFQRGSLLGSIFEDFADFALKKCAEIGVQKIMMEDFWEGPAEEGRPANLYRFCRSW